LANVLLEARLTSTTQNACIDSIARSLIGKGLSVQDVEEPNAELFTWFKNVNTRGQSFSEALIETVDGERAFGNQFIEVVRGSVAGKRYLKVYNHSMLYCRLAANEDFSEPTGVILSKLLAKRGYQSELKKNTPVIPLWNNSQFDNNVVWTRGARPGEQRTMLHFKNQVSGIEYYGLPASVASLRYQVLESKAAQYNIDNFDNNMVLGGMLIFKSSMSHDEAVEQAREILLTHVGEGKTGRIAVISSEEGLNDVEFINYNTQKEGSYIDFDKRVEEKIICANAWDSVLAGINRSSTLGNGSQYIRSIWDVKDAVLLHPLRDKLIEKVIKPIINIWAEWFGVPEVLNYEWKLQTSMPFSYMADLDPNKFFQVNEARSKAGLTPDEKKNGMYLAEMQGPQQPNQFDSGFTKTDGSNGSEDGKQTGRTEGT
jgi:hypothetical protein